MSTDGYEPEPGEVDALVRAALAELLADLPADHLARYHELTRMQRVQEGVGREVVKALAGERGAALRALRAQGLRQAELVEPTGLGSQQRVQQVMARGRHRSVGHV